MIERCRRIQRGVSYAAMLTCPGAESAKDRPLLSQRRRWCRSGERSLIFKKADEQATGAGVCADALLPLEDGGGCSEPLQDIVERKTRRMHPVGPACEQPHPLFNGTRRVSMVLKPVLEAIGIRFRKVQPTLYAVPMPALLLRHDRLPICLEATSLRRLMSCGSRGCPDKICLSTDNWGHVDVERISLRISPVASERTSLLCKRGYGWAFSCARPEGCAGASQGG